MAKKIVIHYNGDLDSIAGAWMIRRFLPGWEEAEIAFVPVGKTLDDKPADRDPDVLHIDTGGGELDHHQEEEITSATAKTLEKIKKTKGVELKKLDLEALEKIAAVVTEVDNARELAWPEIDADRREFNLDSILRGLNRLDQVDDSQVVELGMRALDGVFSQLKAKIDAQAILKEKGLEFDTPWGKAVGLETANDQVLWEGEKAGYSLVVKQDPRTGHTRIYARWDRGVDLSGAYKKLKEKDPKASWYLHQSKNLLLNASTKHPDMVPTKLSLEEIIGVLKE